MYLSFQIGPLTVLPKGLEKPSEFSSSTKVMTEYLNNNDSTSLAFLK